MAPAFQSCIGGLSYVLEGGKCESLHQTVATPGWGPVFSSFVPPPL